MLGGGCENTIEINPEHTPTIGSVEGDKAALIKIYEDFDGENWKDNTNWNTDTDLSEWEGISTNSAGRVTEINLYYNDLSGDAMDLTAFDELTFLDISNCAVNSIDISNCTKLEMLGIPRTNITSLNLKNNPCITYLYISRTGITSLDLSNLSELTDLSCSYVKFTSLDLSKNTKLESFEMHGTELESLDFSASTNISYIGIDKKENTDPDCIKEITVDISFSGDIYADTWGEQDEITYTAPFYISGYQYPKINYNGYDQVTHEARLAEEKAYLLDLYKESGLQDSGGYDWNEGTDISSWSGIYTSTLGYVRAIYLNFSITTDNDFEISGLQSLTYLSVYSNFNSVTIKDLPALQGIDLYAPASNNTSSLSLGNLPSVSSIWISDINITSLDVSELTNLQRFAIGGTTQLTTLSLPSSLLECVIYDCTSLSSVDLSKLTSAYYLIANGNNITKLDLSKNTSLQHLECGYSPLAEVVLPKGFSFVDDADISSWGEENEGLYSSENYYNYYQYPYFTWAE